MKYTKVEGIVYFNFLENFVLSSRNLFLLDIRPNNTNIRSNSYILKMMKTEYGVEQKHKNKEKMRKYYTRHLSEIEEGSSYTCASCVIANL